MVWLQIRYNNKANKKVLKMKVENLVILAVIIIMAILISVSSFNVKHYRIEKEKTKQLELTLEMTKIQHGITNKTEAIVNQK